MGTPPKRFGQTLLKGLWTSFLKPVVCWLCAIDHWLANLIETITAPVVVQETSWPLVSVSGTCLFVCLFGWFCELEWAAIWALSTTRLATH
jgi:hypothetical protein